VLLELTVAEQRFNAVMEVLRDELTVIEVADRYGVSRQAVHGWLRRYRTGGLDALADRSHRPDTCPHQMPAAVEARICELRRHHPGWGQRRLAHELAREGVDPPPGLTSIYRALVRNGLIQPKARRRPKADYRRWERARPMELWQLDVMGGIWLADGRELKAVTGIDDHSRFCVAAGLVERATARNVCRIFTAALARYGSPEELLTDNGKVFTGRLGPHPSEVLFDRICRERGITHRLTGVRCPTTTGKIERFHKTLRAELLTGRRFDSLAHAQQVLDAWLTTTTPSVPTRPSPCSSRPGASNRPPPPCPGAPPAPARHGRPDRNHPPSGGQRPDRSLLPAGLSRPAPGRPGGHRAAAPDRAAGVPRRPTHPNRSTSQHQGGGPTPSTPTPPAQTTQDQLGRCQPSPGTKPESINRNWTAPTARSVANTSSSAETDG
jgi:transposase InsO family protein